MSRRIGVLFVIGSATAVAGPSGRVVRVERVGGNASVAPRLCEVRGDTGTCVGDQPKIGQTVFVLDEQHGAAEVQIVDVASVAASCATLWTVKTRAVRGVVAGGAGVGVIDPGLRPSRARLVDKHHLPPSPSGLSGDEVWRAIDRDGDGTADILITRYSCDAAGTLVPGGATYCVDVWSWVGAQLTRATQLNFAQCSP